MSSLKSKFKNLLYYLFFFISILIFPLIFSFIKLIGFIFIIRITNIATNRYGHLALNPEIYLIEKKQIKEKKFFDIFYESKYGICNKELFNLWKKKILILPRFLVGPTDEILNRIYKDKNIHTISGFNSLVRDINCNFDNTHPSFKLSINQEEECIRVLKDNNIDIKNIRYVCLFNRDNAFLESENFKKDWYYLSHHNYNIQNFSLAANALTAKNIYVFRMGAKVEGEFGKDNSKIVDYSNLPFRTELMDIFLAINCLFGISCGTGSSHVSVMFRKPMLDLNANLHHLMTYMKDSVLLSKHYYSEEKKRNLSLNEILDYEEVSVRHRDKLDEYKIKINDCSPEEIKDATMELLDRIEGNFLITDEINKLQENFKSKNWSSVKKTINGKEYKFHNIIRANYSSNFLLQNKDWLN